MNFVRKTLLITLLTLLCTGIHAQEADTTTQHITPLSRLDYTTIPKHYIVGKLTTSGLKHINSELLLNTTGIQAGDSITIPGDQLTIVSRKLWEQRHFSDIKIETHFRENDTVDININLKERTRVSNWQFAGIKPNAIKDLNEKLKLRRNSELSDYVMNLNMKQIRGYYDEKAFRNADITYSIEPDTALKSNVVVTFFVNRGPKVRIKEFKFEGNDNITSKRLSKSFKLTHKKSINFLQNTKYNEADFDEDRKNLIDYYNSQGYRDAQLIADSIYMIDHKNMGIWMKVKEGKKYYYRHITWIGNSIYKTSDLENMLQIKRGDTYDSEAMKSRLGIDGKAQPGDIAVQSLYTDKGYLAFQIEPVETVIGDSIDVQIRIVEGKQFRLNKVSFDGNTRTNDHVIRRELNTLPGDLYSQSMLVRSYQRLAQMGQFDAASFATPDVLPNMQQETVDIKYSLKEISNDQLELSGGWGAGMFIASVGINFTNVSVRKLFDKNAWRPYPAGDNQTIGLKVQTNGTYYRALSVNFTEPWLGGRKPNSLSVSFFTSRETNAYYIGQTAEKHFGTIGGSVGIGKRLNWPDPYFNLYVGVQYQAYNMKDWDYFLIKNGSSNVLAFNLSVNRNSVDDPYQYPSQGSDISLSVLFTPPYSLFNGKDYTQAMTEQERYKWIEYHKWKFHVKWFFPLSRDNKLVLMARAQFGYLGHYNSDKLSPFEGFQMGGDGLAGYNVYGVETVGLRGYANNSLTPLSNYGIYARIFSKYSLELRYPLVRQGATLVYALIFAEAGNSFLSLAEFKPFNLKRSLGVGLRVNLPVLGMLGLDWGYGFDPIPESPNSPSGAQFHFSMGIPL